MTPREELEALRRIAVLEAKATGGAAPSGGGSSSPPSTGAPSADSGLPRPASAPTSPDLAADMPWYEKALVGAGGGMRNIYLGGKNLVGLGTPEEAEERKDWARTKSDLGGWGTAGEMVGEGVATLPVGGAVGLGGKVLARAVPALAKLAPGSWTALAARGGAEGAASNVLAGPEDNGIGENATSGGLTGAVVGTLLPKTLKGAGRAVTGAVRELSPTNRGATSRAYNALERTLGKDELDRAINQVENPLPSMLPRTTAASSSSARMGALERGARGRGNVDFSPHDEEVSRKAWSVLQGATDSADQVPGLQKGVQDIMSQGKALIDALPLSQKNRAVIAKELLAIRNGNEVIANPNLGREIDNALAALDNPEATLGVLPQLNWRLSKEAGDSTAMRNVQDVFKRVTDERSKNQFTNMQTGYGATMDQLKAAEAAQRLRGKFVDETGFPSTTQYYGEAGGNAVPKMESAPLRRAIGQESRKGNVQLMDPDKVTEMGSLADQLRQHEIYKPALASGSAGIDMGAGEGAASTALNASPIWRLRGALGSVFKGLNDATQKRVDQALLSPDDFLKMVDSRRALNKALEPWEAKLDSVLRGATRSASVEETQE